MQASEIKTKRILAGISGDILCRAVPTSRSGLSNIERGFVSPRPDELKRILAELDRLISAKARLNDLAAEGWPTTGAAA